MTPASVATARTLGQAPPEKVFEPLLRHRPGAREDERLRRTRAAAAAVTVVALLGLAAASIADAGAATTRPRNVYTPVVATLLSPNDPAPVLGTDRRYHLLYELRLSNRGPIPATLQQLDVVDADSRVVVQTFEGDALASRVRDVRGVPAGDTAIEPGGERLLVIDLAFPVGVSVPLALAHRLTVLGPTGPRATQASPASYSIGTVQLDGPSPVVLAPPLRGNGWVVTSGCCDVGGVDRTTVLPVNGALWSPLRFAVDLAQLDDNGLFVHDDPTQLGNYTGYGADVLASAPGRVVALSANLPDLAPGATGDPATSFESADGNYIVVDLGNGLYVFYGNLQPGSLLVKVGDHVQRREVLGTVGNSAQGGFPHLQFRVMSGSSPYGSDGLPFVLSGFAYEGPLNVQQFVNEGVTGNYAESRMPNPDARRRELPLGFDIIDFGSPGGAGAVGRT
jgi:Peptidase family M23